MKGFSNVCRAATAGFTLIELLVVVLIIGILSAVALPQYDKAVMKSRMSAAIPIAKSIKDNLTMFHLSNGRYPTSAEFADMVDFGDKNCNTSGACRIGNYLVAYRTSPLVGVIYSPGSGLTATTQTEKIGVGVVRDYTTNDILTLACAAWGTKARQICSVNYRGTIASHDGVLGDVNFFIM